MKGDLGSLGANGGAKAYRLFSNFIQTQGRFSRAYHAEFVPPPKGSAGALDEHSAELLLSVDLDANGRGPSCGV